MTAQRSSAPLLDPDAVARAWTDPQFRNLIGAVDFPPDPYSSVAPPLEAVLDGRVHYHGEEPRGVSDVPVPLTTAIEAERRRSGDLIEAWTDALGPGGRLPPAAVAGVEEWAERRAARRHRYARHVRALLRERSFAAARRAISGSTAPVAGVVSLGGDTHLGGREAVRIDATDGTRTVLRPTPLWGVAGLSAGGALLAQRTGLRVRAPRTLRVGDFEVVEWVEHQPERGAGATCAEFFANVGALAALSWLVGLADLHVENVVADETSLVPIDCEFVGLPFPPSGALFLTGLVDRPGRSRPLAPLRAGLRSPAGVGVWTERVGDRRVLRWGSAGRPNHHWIRGADGSPARAGDHVDALVAGCGLAVDALVAHKDVGDLADALDRTRWTIRPTAVYAALLAELAQPAVDSRAHRSARLASRLAALSDSAEGLRPDVVAAEIGDLAAGDVPYFDVSCRSRRLTHWRGCTVPTGRTAGVDAFNARLGALRSDPATHRRRFADELRAALVAAPRERPRRHSPRT